MDDVAEANKCLDKFAASLGAGKQSQGQEQQDEPPQFRICGEATHVQHVLPTTELVAMQKTPRAWARAFFNCVSCTLCRRQMGHPWRHKWEAI